MKYRRLELKEALREVSEKVKRLPSVTMNLDDLRGDVCVEDVVAPMDQPPFPRSPLDGYAVHGAETLEASSEKPVTLKVVGKVYAGTGEIPVMGAHECVRIMTGGTIPADADAVIKQEDTNYGEDYVQIYRGVKPWSNYCYKGEDFKKGDLLIPRGTVLDYTGIAVLASAGYDQVRVPRRPKVAFFSTGDELAPVGRPLPPGKIYDSNFSAITSRLIELGCKPQASHLADDPAVVKDAVLSALTSCDFVVTTGGVSVGQKDILVQVLEELSRDPDHTFEEIFFGLAMKPGSPSKLVLIDGKPLLCLSGNPFAAAAVFELIGRQILAALTGRPLALREGEAILRGDFKKSSPNERILRAKISRDATFVAEIAQSNSSGQIHSMLGCSGFVDIPAGSGPLSDGSLVKILS